MGISLEAAGSARAVLIAGPTAGGKSAAALELAEEAARRGRAAWIVNADAMQVYDALRVITARPGAEEERRAPHRLYGHVPAATRYSVGTWLADVGPVMEEADAAGALVIAVGGTGLYFKALTEGLAAVPEIPQEVRTRWSERLSAEGVDSLYRVLRERDPASAAAIRRSDPQRILRALEVLDATGRPLDEWRKTPQTPLVGRDEAVGFVVEPDRATLHRRIEARFDRMVGEGALEEVAALVALGLAPSLPAMKAIGVREFAAFLRKEIPLQAATDAAKAETRRLAKRQLTWFRHQMRDWTRVE